MSTWNSGYVTDVDYTYGFYKALTPHLLSLFALLRGVEAPGSDLEPRNYCELGCGQGYTTNVLAASNPHIQFYATDFNPGHIAGAQDLARTAKLPNVHFSDDSFGQYLQRRDLPEFDFIVLHGIYSWISPEARQDIVAFIAKRLKPGGIVYISYNCMPGWAAMMPLRHLLTEHAQSQGASRPLLPRVSASLEFIESLHRLEAGYFKSHPLLDGHLKQMKKASRNYIAHEYFNRDLTPFYFKDVIRELSEAKLTWVGPASAISGLDIIHLTKEQQELLAGIDDVDFRETVRDHIVNQQFRRDIFVKGPLRLSRRSVADRWRETRIALTNAGNASHEVKGIRHTLNIQPALIGNLVSTLEAGPRSLREIMGLPAFKDHNLENMIQVISILIEQNALHPCLPEQGQSERKIRTDYFNKAVAERTGEGAQLTTLASPVLGGGVSHDPINLLVWLALHNKEEDIPGAVWNSMTQAGLKLTKDGKTLQTKEENLAELKLLLSSHETKTQPIWRTLGLLGRAMNAASREPIRLGA
ncbi:class I SAM-dependent methyltransferase [Microvirga pakistanensis]|uniref:class I SAM-dependent methyltransferase n=1 Tax=Microvirga pakistanensis TaxID=1682650 RepID=UPI00106AF716|nr:class I SAM-dependent methyltransferase [Microvirga pakistanensis]